MNARLSLVVVAFLAPPSSAAAKFPSGRDQRDPIASMRAESGDVVAHYR
jgi:hypothetical protein